ncbi:hypothetical protein [Alteromonas sp. CYL-A6]|uniref:hypothetical protein n=1 Tax=Alteromonas nitratireducens TaxID=3390813 RepID=UPI0034AE5F9C
MDMREAEATAQANLDAIYQQLGVGRMAVASADDAQLDALLSELIEMYPYRDLDNATIKKVVSLRGSLARLLLLRDGFNLADLPSD